MRPLKSEESLIGKEFGKLKVLRLAGRGSRGFSWWCSCICGKEVKLSTFKLTKDGYETCGCSHTDWSDVVHPGPLELRAQFPLSFVSWGAIMGRCVYARSEEGCYANIQVCEEWYWFENFVRDMGERPSKSHSIDRRDPDGHYEKLNCRWITKSRNCGRTRFSEERRKEISVRQKEKFAKGYVIPLSRQSRVKIGEGGKQREGRHLQKCQSCNRKAYLPQCQKCRKANRKP